MGKQRLPRFHMPAIRPRILVGGAVVCLIILLGTGLVVYAVHGSNSHNPPAAAVQEHPPAQEVLPGTTDLQNLKQSYGPFRQLTPSDQQPQTGKPAVLLLQDGGYFVSTKWKISSSTSGWGQDISGNINNIDVMGNYADITDADNNPYVVGVDQAFIVSSNPGTVLRIDSTGNVFTMSLAQATAVRQSITQHIAK